MKTIRRSTRGSRKGTLLVVVLGLLVATQVSARAGSVLGATLMVAGPLAAWLCLRTGNVLPWALLGIGLGALFFRQFSDQERVLELGIGVIALGFVLYQAVRGQLLQVVEKKRPSPLTTALLGTTSGFTSTLAHVGGPPMMIYLLPQKLPRNLFVGTTAVFFFIVNLVKLIPYYLLGLLVVGNLAVTLVLLPVLWLGTRLGVWLNQRVSELWFNRVLYVILVLVSLQLILDQSLVSLLFG